MSDALQAAFVKASRQLNESLAAAEERLMKRVLDLEGFKYKTPGDEQWKTWADRVTVERQAWRLLVSIDGEVKYLIVSEVSADLALDSSRQELITRLLLAKDERAAR